MTGQRSGAAFEGQALRAPREPTAPFKFGRDHVPVDHTKGPLNLGAAGRMLITKFVVNAKLCAQPSAKSRARPLSQFATVHLTKGSCHVAFNETVQPRSIIEDHVGLTGEEGHHVAFSHFTQERHQLVTDAIAAKREVIVRLVMACLETVLSDERGHITTSETYQRLRRIVDQGGKSIEPGASNHVQQNGFSEVVHGVAGQ
jgi:hypothetical protein